MTTLEQVEKLKEKANVSYEEAKAALDITNGDLLEAMIYLEKQGKIETPHVRAYNTKTGGDQEGPWPREDEWFSRGKDDGGEARYYKKHRNHEHKARMKALWQKFCALVKKANANQFVVRRDGQVAINMPITLLAIALLCFFWVTVPLLIIGLFCDFRYAFQGPDFGKDTINTIMNQAADTAESIKRSVIAETQARTQGDGADMDEDAYDAYGAYAEGSEDDGDR